MMRLRWTVRIAAGVGVLALGALPARAGVGVNSGDCGAAPTSSPSGIVVPAAGGVGWVNANPTGFSGSGGIQTPVGFATGTGSLSSQNWAMSFSAVNGTAYQSGFTGRGCIGVRGVIGVQGSQP